jgi:biotin transport system substrate-specific component
MEVVRVYREKVVPEVVLVDIIWPGAGLWRSITLILAGSWLVAFLAQVQIPVGPVPMTGQTLGVLLIGVLLGSRKGAASMLMYLAQGAAGLPFFSAGGGALRLLGPTGGYLAGFVLAAFLVGTLSERGWDHQAWKTALAMVIGNLAIYICGLLWLARFVPVESLLRVGLLPFLLGDAFKIGLSMLLLPSAWHLINGRIPKKFDK